MSMVRAARRTSARGWAAHAGSSCAASEYSPRGIELRRERVFVLELAQALGCRLFGGGSQQEDRERVAALPAAVQGELVVLPQGFHSGDSSHEEVDDLHRSYPQRGANETACARVPACYE
jgi:hypothetical protein